MRDFNVLSSVCVALVCGTASAQVLFFDFGRTDLQADPLSYNNFIPGVSLIADAINENGVSTGIAVEIVDPFFDSGESSSLGSESPSGDAAQFDVEATDDYYFGHTTPFAGADPNPIALIEFSNLSANGVYSLTIFAGRTGVNDTRDAEYEATGANSSSGVLNASNNESEVLVLSGLIADGSGVISLSVSPGPNNDNGNGFYYLGAIRMDVVPAPGTAAAFGVFGTALLRRRRA